MKKIINTILLLGTAISTYIALKYSTLPFPSFLPDKWSTFWTSSTDDQQKYVLLYDIAVGFIMSALFYFIVEEIPDKIRIRKAKQLINAEINQIAEFMEQIISIVIQKYNRERSFKLLSQKDFLILDGETQRASENISWKTTTYAVKRKRIQNTIHQYGNFDKLIKDNLKEILDKISIIKNYEYFYAADSQLVECIRKIEGCALINKYAVKDQKNTPCFLFHGTSTAMADFVCLYIDLLKRRFHTKYTVTTLDNKQETNSYRNKRENGTFLQYAADCQRKRQDIALTNPTAIINGSKYTTDLLVSYFKQTFIATYLSIDNIDLNALNTFKYIIFIIDSDTQNTITNILNSNKISAKILLITEQTFLKKPIKNRLKSNNIIDELFFKAAFYIGKRLRFVFFKQEPSEKTIVDIQSKIKKQLYKDD